MPRKQVLVQLDEDLLEELDREAERAKQSRSEVLRRAARAWLLALEEVRFDREYAAAYRRIPDDPVITETLGRIAAEMAPPYDA